MHIHRYPDPATWPALCRRPAFDQCELEATVSAIMQAVRSEGDKALYDFAARYDRAALSDLSASQAELHEGAATVDPALADAIRLAAGNIERFHRAQVFAPVQVETMPGVICRQEARPLERVGLYVPGGSAPLFSTLLMLAIPARLAGVRDIAVCTPPDSQGRVHPAICFVAQLLGLQEVYKVGGAQAIAAMAYGTASIGRVDKIFGPGNQYVTMAKMLVARDGVAIDMPAGPSELLIIADRTASPAFLAADLLSQAEHGPDSQVVLVSDDASILGATLAQVDIQVRDLPREGIARQALAASLAVLLPSMDACMAFSNQYAPEHLILAVDDPEDLVREVIHAGSVFLGHYSCESAGDYASGTNHTLPTSGHARTTGGVSVDSFIRKITFQTITRDGLAQIGPAIETMAAAEQLDAHRRAVRIRLNDLRHD
jgi:histidinol dehydrogenase